MATVKIDTAVNTEALQDLTALFTKFSAGVHGQAAAWGKVAAAGGEARGTLEDAARSVRSLADNMDDVLARTRGLDQETEKVSRRWTSLARGTKEAAGHIKDATGSLLKWAGITGLVAGVAGFGAEHLITGLGRSVSANRSTALGLNTTYGGLAAARLGYERYGDGTSLLGHVADAQGDPSRRLPFGALGMRAGDYEGKDSADVVADVMRRAKDVLDKVPDDQLGSRLRVTHLDEFFSLEDARRIKHDSRADVYGQADSIGRNRGELDLSPKVQRQWQDFTTQISRAGTTIETILVNRLVALEPGLLKLSEAATKIAASLLAKDGPASQWLGELNHGLEWLADNVDKPEFQTQVRDFFAGLVDLGKSAWGLAKSAAGLLHWLAKLTGDEDTKPTAPSDPMAFATGMPGGTQAPIGSAPFRGGRRGLGQPDRALPPLGGGMTGLRGAGRSGSRGAWWTDERMKHAYDKLVAGGLSPLEAQGQIARMAYVEAGAGPTARNSSSGALGIYQGLGSRKPHSLDFDDQLNDVIREKKTSERYSHRIGLAAKTDYDAAISASSFERAEGYDPRSGRDNHTGKTMAAIPEVRRIVAPTTVTVNKNVGGNPSQTVAMAAAPQ